MSSMPVHIFDGMIPIGSYEFNSRTGQWDAVFGTEVRSFPYPSTAELAIRRHRLEQIKSVRN